MARKLLVVQVAALGWDLVQETPGFRPAESFFPALTCSAQASFRTATAPNHHGVVANGVRVPELRKILFWEQSSALVEGERIWEKFRAAGRSVGMMFWQQSLGDGALDLVYSPAPIHKHSGGMIQAAYTQPPGLERALQNRTRRKFNLFRYWGPLASRAASDWIVNATCELLAEPQLAPDLLFSYIPHLDYDLQRHGPDSPKAARALKLTLQYLERLQKAAGEHGYEFLFYGDYAIEPVTEAIFPNRRLREAGLLQTRAIKKMFYADYFASPAFAMADHQIAHVYTRDAASTEAARAALSELPGIASILDRENQSTLDMNHPRGGDLLLIAKPGKWFAYPWWSRKKEAPDFASHVDIHNKPGYDPCELFFGWPPWSVSTNTAHVRGSHGRPGENVAWKTSLKFAAEPASMLDVARFTKVWLDSQQP